MALRIADAHVVPIARPLAERAAAAHTAADWPTVTALWAEARAIEDPADRYVAVRQLTEETFAAPSAAPAIVAHRFLTGAQGLLGALELDPREPLLLNFAGVFLYEIGELSGADALFEAAERLSPGETSASGNRLEIERRRKARINVAEAVPPDVRVELAGLRARATAVAAKARPAEGLTLSLCMIVRDEEAMLGDCLSAVAPAVDEIVVVDTGSVDRTKEIAEAHGATIIDFAWTGSFADARNVSFGAATSDWILFLDADEVLVSEDVEALRALTGRTWREAFYLRETNYVGALEDGSGVTHNALRVFRNRPEYRFEGRIHEQILHTLPTSLVERFEETSVRVEHFGYLGVVRDAKKKTDRNIKLLELQAQEGVTDPFHQFNLGSEYLAVGEPGKALEYYENAWDQIVAAGSTAPAYTSMLAVRMAKSYRGDGRPERTVEFVDGALPFFPGFTDLVFEQANALVELDDDAAAQIAYERCLEMGDAPAKYTSTLGAGSFLSLTALAVIRRRAGDLAGAEQLLRRSLAEHPRFLAPVDPLAGLLLQRGLGGDAVIEELEACIGELSPSVRFVLGMALYEAGHAEEAEPHFRAVLERQVSSDLARVALGETLLSQRRFDEARDEVAAVPAGSACTQAARRIELFARLAGADADGARTVLTSASYEDLDTADRATFTAWADALSGRTPKVTPEGAVALGTTLEALLRVREVQPFAALVPALDTAVPVERDRREILANMYLRHGFLASAAEEWLAVCETAPDAPALIGLAQLAVAQGDDENALVFAEAALEAAPETERAQLLVGRLRQRIAVAA